MHGCCIQETDSELLETDFRASREHLQRSDIFDAIDAKNNNESIVLFFPVLLYSGRHPNTETHNTNITALQFRESILSQEYNNFESY